MTRPVAEVVHDCVPIEEYTIMRQNALSIIKADRQTVRREALQDAIDLARDKELCARDGYAADSWRLYIATLERLVSSDSSVHGQPHDALAVQLMETMTERDTALARITELEAQLCYHNGKKCRMDEMIKEFCEGENKSRTS